MEERMHSVRILLLCLATVFLTVVMLTLLASETAQADTEGLEPLGDPATGWISDEVISTTPGLDEEPELATGPDGTLHATWQHDSRASGQYEICHAFSEDGGSTWSTCTIIPTTAKRAMNPDIVVSPHDGRIFIAFEANSTSWDILVAHSDTGFGWTVINITTSPEHEHNPSLTLEHDVDPYVVHVAFESRAPHELFVYASSDRGDSWVQQFNYTYFYYYDMGGPALAYQRCTDAIPRHYVFHFDVDVSGANVVVHWSEDGGATWLGPGMLHSSETGKGELTVAASRDGDTLMVGWHEWNQMTGYMGVRVMYDDDPTTPNQGWGIQDFSHFDLEDKGPKLTVDGAGTNSTTIGGKFHFVWRVYSDIDVMTNRSVYYTSISSDLTGGWSPLIDISDSTSLPWEILYSGQGMTTQKRGGTWYPVVCWTDARGWPPEIHYTTPGSRVVVDSNVTGTFAHVDGQNVSLPASFNWPAGLNHTIEAPSQQYINETAAVAWQDWSDGGARNHTVLATIIDTTYTAGFWLQYRISFLADPAIPGLQARIDGVLEPLPKSYWWYDGSVHEILAPSPQIQTSTSRYVFDHWSDLGAVLHDVTVTGDDPFVCFFTREFNITIDTHPTGLDIEVDSSRLSAPRSFWWVEGSLHKVNAPSLQPAGGSSKYVFVNWSGDGPQSHMIIVIESETLTAYFRTEGETGASSLMDSWWIILIVVIETVVIVWLLLARPRHAMSDEPSGVEEDLDKGTTQEGEAQPLDEEEADDTIDEDPG